MLSEQTLLYKGAQAPITAILLVEVNATFGEDLMRALSHKAHYHVYLTSDSLGAMKFTRHIKPQLFILEHHPPILNGIRLYDRLHANRELADIPAIIICPDVEDIQDELATRKLLALSIPFNMDEFLATLEEAVAQHQLAHPRRQVAPDCPAAVPRAPWPVQRGRGVGRVSR